MNRCVIWIGRRRGAGLAAAFLLLGGGGVLADEAGRFVIPAMRPAVEGVQAGTRFAYWDLFLADDAGFNVNFANPPALLGGGDDDGNPTTLTTGVGLWQTAAASAFVTGSGAIYSFSEPTGFRVDYAGSGATEVTNVIFQTMTGGRRFDVENIRLEYAAGGGEGVESVRPVFKALDDPQTGAFAERLVSGFQWDLTGRGVRDFRLVFAAPGSSMPFWEAQLDVVEGAPFVQQLGSLLLGRVWPDLRFEVPGRIRKNLPVGAETRFHLPGSELRLTAVPETGFAAAGWLIDGQVRDGAEAVVSFAAADVAVDAIFAPLTFTSWRAHWFDHANALLGTPADHANEVVSGPSADPDGDGADNFTEFAFGGDPYRSDAAESSEAATAEGGAAVLRYRQPASDQVGVTYRLLGSDDLVSWAPVPAEVVGRQLDRSGYWRVRVREVVAGRGARPFLKMEAALKP